MELNSSVNTFIGGMNMDSDISLLKENQYTYAENIRLLANEDSTTGILQNRDCLKRFINSNLEEILGVSVTRLNSRECIVVITKVRDTDGEYKNSVKLFYIDETKDPWLDGVTVIIDKAKIGWDSGVKIITNSESDTVSKIYVIDGIHGIKVIDITKTYNSEEISEDTFDIAPNCRLHKPELNEMISGNLEVGAIQYAYQLFTKHGAESGISPVSQLIIIPKKSGVSSKDVYGGNKGELSNFGCLIKIDFEPSSEFDHIRIYRIRYESNNDVANIKIISETEISGDYIIYNDVNESMISLITVDEFNMLTLKTFVPKTIEKHDNRLFAAGITEETWDIEYDARAYRCDSTGLISLHHTNQLLNISGVLTEDGLVNGKPVDEKHDCINPSNRLLYEEDSYKYIYGIKDGKYVVGGTGPNVSYEFCFTDVICSSDAICLSYPEYTPAYKLDLKNSLGTPTHVEIRDNKDNTICVVDVPDTSIRLDYSDSLFTSNFLGYQRDEIYRFGIVFYNKKGQKSPVHWIGDIRMPAHCLTDTVDGFWKPFHFGNDYYRTEGGSMMPITVELLGKALGIKFTVTKPKDENAVSWEIVRCPRTEIDRTIVTQALLSKLINFDTWDNNDRDFGDADIRPMLLPNASNKYRVGRTYRTDASLPGYEIEGYEFDTVDFYYELISPEIAVNKTAMVDNIKNGKLCLLYTTQTVQYVQSDSDENTWSKKWGIKQELIYTLSESKTETVETNDTFGGYFTPFSNSTLYLYTDSAVGNGNAILQKYYKYGSTEINRFSTSLPMIDLVLIPTMLPLIYDHEVAKSYANPIGDKIYVNTTVGGKSQLNTHGVCAIIKTDNAIPNTLQMYEAHVYNIKQSGVLYGGDTFVNRVNSTYMPCVQHSAIEENTVCVFGGDTYLGVFDYLHTSMRQYKNDPDDNKHTNVFVNCYIPLESTVNMYLFNNDSYSKTVEGMIGQNLLLNEPTVTGNYAQTKPMYEYNSAYSVDANAQIFVPELLYTDENPVFDTRIICSELKTNNEIIDSWTKFKFANYLDVDSQYGPVTNLKSFNGKLLFWLDSAVGVASVNERSLIQDNNISQLTLGTGGILVRYDYYTTLNGSSMKNDRSICNSASTLYWYDPSKHEICAINNTVIELSKNKGVKSWCNKLLGNTDTLGWYDWKYNEILFQNASEDVKRSIVFNELLNVFTGFYTYPVKYIAQLVDNLVTFDEIGNIYLHNSDVNYEPFESKITYVVNKGYPETKVFDNVWFDAELANNNTLKSIVFNTKTQETNPIGFTDIENREDTYRFPIPRDKNGVARMRGKYLICDYTFDCTNDGDFKIPYIKTTFRISKV